jgi:hypothetical protein
MVLRATSAVPTRGVAQATAGSSTPWEWACRSAFPASSCGPVWPLDVLSVEEGGESCVIRLVIIVYFPPGRKQDGRTIGVAAPVKRGRKGPPIGACIGGAAARARADLNAGCAPASLDALPSPSVASVNGADTWRRRIADTLPHRYHTPALSGDAALDE